MKTKYIPLLLLSLFLIIGCCGIAQGVVTHSGELPADGATNIWVNKEQFAITLNSTTGQLMTGTMTLYGTSDIYTLTSVANGTFYVNFSSGTLPFDPLTNYSVDVHVRNESFAGIATWTNTSYGFTTGASARLSDSNDLSASEIVLVGLISIVIILAVAMYMLDIAHDKKLSLDKLVGAVLAVIVLGLTLAFL